MDYSRETPVVLECRNCHCPTQIVRVDGLNRAYLWCLTCLWWDWPRNARLPAPKEVRP
jgi:hypothetical protein